MYIDITHSIIASTEEREKEGEESRERERDKGNPGIENYFM